MVQRREKQPQERREMTDEAAGKLTAAIIRLADALATTKEGNEKERSPYNPLKEKAREETLSQTPNACVRVRAGESGCGVRAAFARPSVEEVAAHIREKGYTFDADEFWHFYDSKGWLIGNHVMKSWQSACVTWQKRCNRDARREAARQAHIDARMDARERMRRGEEPAAADLPRPSDFLVPGTFGREG